MFPLELINYNQWVLWKYETRFGKNTKVPYNIHGTRASTTNPLDWSSYHRVSSVISESNIYDGVGFVFTDKDPFIGIDWDNIATPSISLCQPIIELEFLKEIKDVNSYAEYSPSGKGVHVICKGIPPAGKMRGNGREMYKTGRFFTVTGNQVGGTPDTINVASIESLKAIKEKIDPTGVSQRASPPMAKGKFKPYSNLEVTEIVTKCKEDREFGKTFVSLMKGDFSSYQSQSEADYHLCCIVAMYTDNMSIMNAIVRHSKLYRSKWNTAYGTRTMQQAIDKVFKNSLRKIIYD